MLLCRISLNGCSWTLWNRLVLSPVWTYIEFCVQIYTHFFISITFLSNARLKWVKNQVRTKQHPEAELLRLENYSLFSSTLSSKNNWVIFKNMQKTSVSVLMKIMAWLILMKMRLKMKEVSHRCDRNKPRPRHGHRYTKYKVRFSLMMIVYTKQHLSNIWSSVDEKVNQHLDWV